MSSNVTVCGESRAMKSGSSLRFTSLPALLVLFVGQRLHALGKIIAQQLEHPCANCLDEVNSRWKRRATPTVTQLPALRELRNWWNKE